jgi:hypothetical protein
MNNSTNFKDLYNKVVQIENRNSRVEADKAWETSLTRKFSILILTYFSIGLFMTFINIENPWINAIIPTAGFFISTLSLPLLKKIWIEYVYRKHRQGH